MARTFNFEKFRKDFGNSMSELEQKYHIKVDLGRILYDHEEFRAKMTCTFIDEGTSVEDVKANKDEIDFKKNCHLFSGLTPEHYHKAWNDSKYGLCRLVTIKTRNRKFPVIIEALASGSRYKVNWNMIKKRIGNLDEMTDTA